MVANKDWVAGRYHLKSVTLEKYDGGAKQELLGHLVGFNIFESMNSPCMHGEITIFDAVNIMRDFDIKGEEYIRFEYDDWWGHTRIQEFFVYAITNVKYPEDDRKNAAFIQYTLNFVSVYKMLTEDTNIMQAFNNQTISEYVQNVFDDNYKSKMDEVGGNRIQKRIFIQPTTGTHNIVVPNYTPEQTMEFFARKAFSSDSRNSMFRFFENRNGFWFGDPDWYSSQSAGIDGAPDIPQYYYNARLDLSNEGQETVMRTVMNAHFGERVNSIDDINSGGYKRQIVEIDLPTGIISARPVYDFSSNFESTTEKLVHEGRFLQDRINSDNPRRVFVIKDYNSVGATQNSDIPNDRFYSELLQRRSLYTHHYKYNAFQITIHGDNSLVAGGKIKIEFDERHEPNGQAPKIDKERSGTYYIEAIDHLFINNTYTSKLTISRWGIGK
jgi:hypothetical protein